MAKLFEGVRETVERITHASSFKELKDINKNNVLGRIFIILIIFGVTCALISEFIFKGLIGFLFALFSFGVIILLIIYSIFCIAFYVSKKSERR